MIAFSLSDSEKYFSWASLHFFFATSHSLLRDSNSLLWVRLVEFCTKKKYNTIVSVNYVQKWYFSRFWQTQHDSCTYFDIGKLKTQEVFERGPTSTENEALCPFNMSWRNHMRIAKCLHLLDPFYTSPDKWFNGRIFYMRKSVHTELRKFCYRLQCYLPFKNLPGLVTCKRGLINIETDNLGITTTQEYNSLLPVDRCRSKRLCFISLLFEFTSQIKSQSEGRYSAGASSIVFAVFSLLLTVAVQYFPPEWNLVPANDRCKFAPVRFVPMTLLFVPMTLSWVQCYEGEPWWARAVTKVAAV